ncbi:hypothetical protein HY837_06375 [archaeon]|nr:hypothetical protein [archaeon]
MKKYFNWAALVLSVYTFLVFLTSYFIPDVNLTPIPQQYSQALPIYISFILTLAVLLTSIASVVRK